MRLVNKDNNYKVTDILYWILIFISLANVNSIVTSFGHPPYFSFVGLVVSIVLISVSANKPSSIMMMVYSLLVISYLLIGGMVSIMDGNINSMLSASYRYFGALFTLYSIYSYTSIRISSLSFRSSTIKLIFGCVFMALISVFFARWLPHEMRMETWDGNVHRASGLWVNPNESAMLGCIAIAMLLNCIFFFNKSSRIKLLSILLLLICLVAVLMTLSKSGIAVIFILLGLLSLMRVRNVATLVLAISFSVVIVGGIVMSAIAAYPYMSASQKSRIDDVVAIVENRGLTHENSSGRLDVWRVNLQMADNLFIGEGLESMKGSREGEWKLEGAHNTYVMLLGESGVIPLILSILFTGIMFYKSISYRAHKLGYFWIAYALVFIVDTMVTHGALLQRYHVVFLGILFAYEEVVCRRLVEKRSVSRI